MQLEKIVVYAFMNEAATIKKACESLPQDYAPFYQHTGRIGVNLLNENKILLSPLGGETYLGPLSIPDEATNIEIHGISIDSIQSRNNAGKADTIQIGAKFKFKGYDFSLYRNDVKFHNP